jgi:hypothetical protein
MKVMNIYDLLRVLLMAPSGPAVGGPYGPYKQVSHLYIYKLNALLTILSLREQLYTEIMRRSF